MFDLACPRHQVRMMIVFRFCDLILLIFIYCWAISRYSRMLSVVPILSGDYKAIIASFY